MAKVTRTRKCGCKKSKTMSKRRSNTRSNTRFNTGSKTSSKKRCYNICKLHKGGDANAVKYPGINEYAVVANPLQENNS